MNSRRVAVAVLCEVIIKKRSLSGVLNTNLNRLSLDADRRLCQEIIYGTLRYYHSLRNSLRLHLKKRISKKNRALEIILCSAIYQLRKLSLPDYAVIDETVKLLYTVDMMWATGFVNAVLRKIASTEHSALHSDAHHDHPAWLATRILAFYPMQAAAIFAANHQAAKPMLRVRGQSRDDYLKELHAKNIRAATHIDHKEAIVLEKFVPIDELPHFQQGHVTVQDANAQLAANLLAVKPGMRVLDACAAPGGKTAHIADKASGLDITALDVSAARVAEMQENFKRLQIEAKVVTAALQDCHQWFDGRLFNRILLDAPCSGTGVIRKHPDILFHRQESDIATLTATQLTLLMTCWRMLTAGGRLLYATCSILPEENTEVIQTFLEKNPDAAIKSLGHHRAIKSALGVLQFLPDEWGDGFFYALLVKD